MQQGRNCRVEAIASRSLDKARQAACFNESAGGELGAQEGYRMRLEREGKRAVVVHDVLAKRHVGEIDGGLGGEIVGSVCEERQALGGGSRIERPHLPERGAAVEAERAESVGLGKLFDLVDMKPGAQPDIAHRAIGVAPPFHQ